MQTKQINLSLLEPNEGQIPDLPRNPRLIKDHKFKKLVQSIREDPEMLDLRELIVFPYNKKFIVIGGNMRLQAMKELNYKQAPCKVLPAETSVDKMKAILIKDNIGYGEHDWDALANEWDVSQLEDWGVDIPNWKKADDEGEASPPDEAAQWFLNIRCESENQAQKLYEEFIQKGLDVKIVT